MLILNLSGPWVPIGTYIEFTLSKVNGEPLGQERVKTLHLFLEINFYFL